MAPLQPAQGAIDPDNFAGLASAQVQRQSGQTFDAHGTEEKKRSKAKAPEHVEENQALVIQTHEDYLAVAQTCLDKARQTLATIKMQSILDASIGGFLPRRHLQFANNLLR